MSDSTLSKLEMLQNKGVLIPNPHGVQIGEEVDIENVSGDGVVIYSGCKIFGHTTHILKGARLGYQGPVTIENCQVGPEVQLNGGFFKQAVFLKKATMGLGAHVREGTILEEEASAAHTVGLKQTILFPFVTLGSLINFCDCLMSGGTSRKDHSEVGSSYIHFNFTPNQDKATPSLLGDVPNGVMLNQRPIFLGGQGGLIGPGRLTFGTVTAAGTICRKDELRPGRLLFEEGRHGGNIPFVPGLSPNISRIAKNNMIYIANLVALKQWYLKVRSAFISETFPTALYNGLIYTLTLAIEERLNRFEFFCGKLSGFDGAEDKKKVNERRQRMELTQRRTELIVCVRESLDDSGDGRLCDSFLKAITTGIQTNGKDYISVIKGLNDHEKKLGTQWLQGIVDGIFSSTIDIIPSIESN